MVTQSITVNDDPRLGYYNQPYDGWSTSSTVYTADQSRTTIDSGKIFYIHIPKFPVYPGSTISSVTLSQYFYQKTSTDAGSESFSIKMHKIANSPAPVHAAVEYTRPQTTASTSWTVNWNTAGGSSYQSITSPNFAAVLNEVIAMPGYAHNNGITLMITATAAGSALEWVFSEESGLGANYPNTVNITWTPPAGVTTGPPVVSVVSFTDPYPYEGGKPVANFSLSDPDNDPVLSVQTQWRKVGDATWTLGGYIAPSGNSAPVALTDFAPGDYEVQMRGWDGAWGPWSTVKSFHVKSSPSAPTNVPAISATTDGPIEPSWTYTDPENDPQTAFRIKWRPVL